MSAEASPFRSALLVEDEPNLAVALKIALKRMGIPIRHAPNLKEASAAIRESNPDFILLDRRLPDGDGLDLCDSLRREGYRGLILMLTASGGVEDRVAGLNVGADDYLPKPFSWPELEARIRALGRRVSRTDEKVSESSATAKPWDLDDSRLRIRGPQGWVELTPLEYKLATTLIAADGSIISRNDLLKDVWGFTLLPKTRTVDHFLGRLRKYFEQNPEDPKHFVTVRGAGYRFER